MRRFGRRRLAVLAVAALLAFVTGVLIGRSDGGGAGPAVGSGSTTEGVWTDLDGNGTLERGAGEPAIERTDLAPAAAADRTLATLVQITDPHVRDEESPARASLLDRLDPVLNSTFRPHEALSPQVLDGVVVSANAAEPDAVLLSGDLIDSAQQNELSQFLATVGGETVEPGSGAEEYEGPQEAANPDPFFYRPDLDAPRHPGLLAAAQEPFVAAGLDAPWHPLVGNHDLLVQGEVPSTPALAALATGDRLLTGIDPGLQLPRGTVPSGDDAADEAALTPELVDAVIGAGNGVLPGPSEPVAADAARMHLPPAEVVAQLQEASGSGGEGPLMDYSFDVGDGVRVIAIDLVNREGGSDGVVHPGQAGWLEAELERAGDRHVIVASHQPIEGAIGGEALLAALDADPDVIATLAGDTHANSIEPRESPAGGYWQIETSSLADYPQQGRAIRVVETVAGGIAIETWTLDGTGSELATIARELSYLDAQGGRPQGNAGEPADRNAILYR